MSTRAHDSSRHCCAACTRLLLFKIFFHSAKCIRFTNIGRYILSQTHTREEPIQVAPRSCRFLGFWAFG